MFGAFYCVIEIYDRRYLFGVEPLNSGIIKLQLVDVSVKNFRLFRE